MLELPTDFAEGCILLIDKPKTWTSFDVVNKVRYEVKTKKVGHAGTLDPLATGLLIVCTGKMTKQINTFQADDKEYICTMVLGATTASYDLETEIENQKDYSLVTPELISTISRKFLGLIQQTAPQHSAKKVNGVRAYELARKGEYADIKSVEVEIKDLEILTIDLPTVTFRVSCSKGTYIRSLVNDIGQELGCGAYMSDLVRTRSGSFLLKDAIQLSDFVNTMKERRSNQNL